MAVVATSIAHVCQYVAAWITALASAEAPWWEAPIPFDRFGVRAVPDHIPDPKAHLAFAVGVPSTTTFADRQRVADGAQVTSELRVRFLARAKPPSSAPKAAEYAALDHEHHLIKRLMMRDTTWPGDRGMSIYLTSRAQACPPPHDWFVHDVVFGVQHRISLL